MQTIQSKEQFRELKDNGKTIFVFSADWCPDCRFIEPFMPEVIEKHKEYTFRLIDRDEFIDICQELDVFGIPSFIAFHNGTEVGRFVSKDRKTEEEINQFIDQLPSE
ncbi:thioredoxin family protein [Virgibacillus soli]|uniref:thioredoxin family protein n=1 Tax=Paracerasibacillus soli TaxID=480284 RepID=UPI0035E85916